MSEASLYIYLTFSLLHIRLTLPPWWFSSLFWLNYCQCFNYFQIYITHSGVPVLFIQQLPWPLTSAHLTDISNLTCQYSTLDLPSFCSETPHFPSLTFLHLQKNHISSCWVQRSRITGKPYLKGLWRQKIGFIKLYSAVIILFLNIL